MSDEQDTPSIAPVPEPSGGGATLPDEPHPRQAADPAGSDDTRETGDTGEKGTPSRAWWLSTRRRRPEWHSLTAAGTATFTGRPRAHYEAVRQGDPVLFYLARPDHGIRAVGVVVEAPQASGKPDAAPDDAELRIEVQLAFEVTNTLGWRSIQADPRLADAEPVRQRSSGTLFALTTAEYRALESLIAERNPELASSFAALDSGEMPLPASPEPGSEAEGQAEHALHETVLPYQPVSAPGDTHRGLPFVRTLDELEGLTNLPYAFLEDVRDLLEDTGQIVLTGPPGTGKTWLARGMAALVAGDPGRAVVAQFHPGTTYEDFIEGLKPKVDEVGRVSYAVLPGLFLRFCSEARLDPTHSYVLVIDEINRAPLSRVFGELLYALEYRGPQGSVELSVSSGMAHSEPFYVPENVLVLGTMNSADRSLAILDYALRRRFRFLELEPNAHVLERWLADHGNSAACRRVVLDLFAEVNRRLAESLDPDHRLGHTYFMLDTLTRHSLDRLWRTAVMPLLAEYFIPPAGELAEYGALFAEAAEELDDVRP